jgi:hypothetical protein
MNVEEKSPTSPSRALFNKSKDNHFLSQLKCVRDFFKQNTASWLMCSEYTGRLIDTRQPFTDVADRTRTIGEKKWIKGTGTNGTADISAIINGRSVKIEAKYNRDRQSEAQRIYQSQVQQAGGIYFIARTFEMFFDWYNSKFQGNG